MNQPGDASNGAGKPKGFAQPPSIALPKGGGAVRGIGEKFAANPVTGTGSMTIPIATSPGRSGFGPQLALSYDSGSGNGPFGLGWDLSLPAITRKTDKGLPRYWDDEESDVFLLSGSEDLVPELKSDGTPYEDSTRAPGYTIHRYRPRIEGLFARIERWTRDENGDVHWRSISKDNVLTLYGRDANARIQDPDDPGRVFSWLISETRDDLGNAVVYEYLPENGTGVDLTKACERNRGGTDDPRRKTNRYLKRIRYGNRKPMLDATGKRPRFLTSAQIESSDDNPWMFEVVFDYGEHDARAPAPNDKGAWDYRQDPFSTYRAGFEVRTCRLCHRVLMFHHFPDETDVGANCLVRSTDFTYRYEDTPADPRNPIHSVLTSVTQCGYKRKSGDGYVKRSLPPVEFEYSAAVFGDTVRDLHPESLENLPYGLDGSIYQWVDLDGDGLAGVLTEQGGAWLYKRNESPLTRRIEDDPALTTARLGPIEILPYRPGGGLGGSHQLLDLAGDGQLDLVELSPPLAGFYERTDDRDWRPFRPFTDIPNIDWQDPNLKLVDVTGDGHADVLITEDQVFTWHQSLAESGFGDGERLPAAFDEEHGPRVVFADGTQTLFLADLSGDGLTDIVRIRNGNVCYWPNLGYGRFGAKVTMDDAPWLDAPDQFDPRRIRLADIDGSGVTDIIYLGRREVRVWLNQSGNAWSKPRTLAGFPVVDNLASVVAMDLLGNGTACLVWSSPLPGERRTALRYLDLMAKGKPHLLVGLKNNLGAETRVRYVASTWFYLKHRQEGWPWITRLPFPVHVVERVETRDHISGNRFTTRYAYHHGFFDGFEREFRGFGMVEQWDTEELAALTAEGKLPAATTQDSTGKGTAPAATNLDAASHVPPVLTRTWFHTGVYLGREHVSDFFAGLLNANDKGEYYREPGLTDPQARALLLPDTALPPGLSVDEAREACRALKGSMLRQEVYALDGSDKEDDPYTVTEQNFTVRRLQPRGLNRHAVFFTHARETLGYHYERNPKDPRISHSLTLEVDDYGNVLRALAIGYGRRSKSSDSTLSEADKTKQTDLLITYTENSVTNPIDDSIKAADGKSIKYPDDYRAPLPAETSTYELTEFKPGKGKRFALRDWADKDFTALDSAEAIDYEKPPTAGKQQKRLIEHLRTRYRGDDLTGLLPLSELEPLALPGESYTLAFTPGLLKQVYTRRRSGQPDEALLPSDSVQLAQLLGGKGADEGGYLQMDGNWWIPSGRVYYSTEPQHTAAQELAQARAHFCLPRRYRDPFGRNTVVDYDGPASMTAPAYDLLVTRTTDALDNIITAANDYRVLQPGLVTDANQNRAAAAFDAVGLVVATAVMGKAGEGLGDDLSGFAHDPSLAELQKFIADPGNQGASMLGKATTRIVYDLERFERAGQPPFAATLAREAHLHEAGGAQTEIQIGFSYSDGFGREIQKKIQAEPGKALEREAPVQMTIGDLKPGKLKRDSEENLVQATAKLRWVGTGRTVFNNKGKPVRQYEPFFSATHLYEPERDMTDTGVSPILFYDPLERVIATLHPNHTYEKVVFDPWQQTTYDGNDTVAAPSKQTVSASIMQTGDPRTDPEIKGHVAKYFKTQSTTWQTWYQQRSTGQLGTAELEAAQKAAKHADTPTVAHLDVLGRPFLTLADNGPDPAQPTEHLLYATRVELDIEDNQRAVTDAKDRLVMRYDYDIAGPEQDEEGPDSIHQASMEAGERWVLNDVTGNPIRAWDSRGHRFKTEYDKLRRPRRQFVLGTDAKHSDPRTLVQDPICFEQIEYGEGQPNDIKLNLRTRVFRQYDGAGRVTNGYDFKGNLLHSTRELADEYKKIIDWSQSQPPGETFTNSTTYDALDRPVHLESPDKSDTEITYNEANLLQAIRVNLRGEHKDNKPVWTDFVTNVDYDAKGQRTRIDYGNKVTTTYTYDPLTYRLTHLLTRRDPSVFANDCPKPPKTGWPGCQVQNLHYTYDPAGNITRIRDDAQQAIFFKNQRVDPNADYTYDAIYRLIEATGREHLGQTGGGSQLPPKPSSHTDSPRVGLLHPGDGKAMGRYKQEYVYDEVGNFLKMIHKGTNPVDPGWTREYKYDEDSLLESGVSGTKSNRLSATRIGAGPIEQYTHDNHGNMTFMPHLPVMRWDFQDQLLATAKQTVADGTPETTYYVYDANGKRVRKVTERQAVAGQTLRRMKERIYVGGYEVYREFGGDGITVCLERDTLHVMDGEQRIALVDTRTKGLDVPPRQSIRYQLANHLGSASVELDCQARIVSFEEYYSYGSTSYEAMGNQPEAPKRYRYTGMERDEENGFQYHGARYCAVWLGEWINADPRGLVDGLNLYEYVGRNPITATDATGTQKEGLLPMFLRFIGESAEETEQIILKRAEGVANASLAQAKRGVKRLGIDPTKGVGSVLMRAGGLNAATVYASLASPVKILLGGAKALAGLRGQGTDLGEGAAKINVGKSIEGVEQIQRAIPPIAAGKDIGTGAGMIVEGSNAEAGSERLFSGVAGLAGSAALALRGIKPKGLKLKTKRKSTGSTSAAEADSARARLLKTITRKASKRSVRLLAEAFQKGKELALRKTKQKRIKKYEGEKNEVKIETRYDDIWIEHTHFQRGVAAVPSDYDFWIMVDKYYKYATVPTELVTGFRWPKTRELLESLGEEMPPPMHGVPKSDISSAVTTWNRIRRNR
jgi:RHS repeat-associated protein